jgi:hypothetical protein
MKTDRATSHDGAWTKATSELRYLHEVEHAGESQYTPLLAIAGLVAFLIIVMAVVLAVSLLAFHAA